MQRLPRSTKCLICTNSSKNSNFKRYCSLKCYEKRNKTKDTGNCKLHNCKYCNELVLKNKSDLGKNIFCNNSCAGSYMFYIKQTLVGQKNVDHQRSNLEEYICQKIEFNFPYIKIEKNYRNPLFGELDIYLPDLNFAIEINGITHYKPIYGDDHLSLTKNKDLIKLEYCKNNNIFLLVIKNFDKVIRIGWKTWENIIKPELLKIISFCETKDEFDFNFKPLPKRNKSGNPLGRPTIYSKKPFDVFEYFCNNKIVYL